MTSLNHSLSLLDVDPTNIDDESRTNSLPINATHIFNGSLTTAQSYYTSAIPHPYVYMAIYSCSRRRWYHNIDSRNPSNFLPMDKIPTNFDRNENNYPNLTPSHGPLRNPLDNSIPSLALPRPLQSTISSLPQGHPTMSFASSAMLAPEHYRYPSVAVAAPAPAPALPSNLATASTISRHASFAPAPAPAPLSSHSSVLHLPHQQLDDPREGWPFTAPTIPSTPPRASISREGWPFTAPTIPSTPPRASISRDVPSAPSHPRVPTSYLSSTQFASSAPSVAVAAPSPAQAPTQAPTQAQAQAPAQAYPPQRLPVEDVFAPSNWRQKYLKYKQKYLQLKKNNI
jgi:hypothetical protein